MEYLERRRSTNSDECQCNRFRGLVL